MCMQCIVTVFRIITPNNNLNFSIKRFDSLVLQYKLCAEFNKNKLDVTHKLAV